MIVDTLGYNKSPSGFGESAFKSSLRPKLLGEALFDAWPAKKTRLLYQLRSVAVSPQAYQMSLIMADCCFKVVGKPPGEDWIANACGQLPIKCQLESVRTLWLELINGFYLCGCCNINFCHKNKWYCLQDSSRQNGVNAAGKEALKSE